MSAALQNLTFIVSLLDKVSGPAATMMKTMDKVTTRIQSGYRKIGYGVAGVAGAGYALDGLLGPTKAMQQALGSLKSLDVTDDVLQSMTRTALQFSTQFGVSASDFVESAYQIQSAIEGLSGNDLPTFTSAAAIMAKGTKADMATITDYVGTLYNIFKTQANEMGRENWIKTLVGESAIAVNIFKTEGDELAMAFSRLTSIASVKGIALSEQLAVLGTLKNTMRAEEAGTGYRSFLERVYEAQDKLSLKFTDSKNHILPMVEILEKIRGKYGDLSDETSQFKVSQAFGKSPEAMAIINALLKDLDGLKHSIVEIGDPKAYDRAVHMAQEMTMSWDKAMQGINSLKIMLGNQLMPQINAFFDRVNSGVSILMRWNALFPELSHVLSVSVVAVFGLVAGVSALSIVMGIAMLASGGLAAMLAILTSPITLTAALIGVAAYAIYDFVSYTADLLAEYAVFEKVFSAWDSLTVGIDGAIGYVMAAFEALKDWFHKFNLWEFLLGGIDELIGKLNLIPGVSIDLGSAPAVGAPAGINPNSKVGGGLLQKVSNLSNDSSRSIGVVNIYPQANKTLSQLVDEIQLAGG